MGYQRSSVALRRINLNIVLNIVAVILAVVMAIFDILIIFVYGHKMSMTKFSILWVKSVIGVLVGVISVIISVFSCRAACCGPYGCCGMGTRRYCMDQPDGAARDKVGTVGQLHH